MEETTEETTDLFPPEFPWIEELHHIQQDVAKVSSAKFETLDVYVELPADRWENLRKPGSWMYLMDMAGEKFASFFVKESPTNKLLVEVTTSTLPRCDRCWHHKEDARVRPWIDPNDLLCYRCDVALEAWVLRGGRIENLPPWTPRDHSKKGQQ